MLTLCSRWLSWSVGVWRTKHQGIRSTAALRSPTFPVDIDDQPTWTAWSFRGIEIATLGGGPSLSGVRPTVWNPLPVELREPTVSNGSFPRTLKSDGLVREILVHRAQLRHIAFWHLTFVRQRALQSWILFLHYSSFCLLYKLTINFSYVKTMYLLIVKILRKTNNYASGFAIWLYLSVLYFLQTATCFICFFVVKIPLFNTRKVVSSNLGNSVSTCDHTAHSCSAYAKCTLFLTKSALLCERRTHFTFF